MRTCAGDSTRTGRHLRSSGVWQRLVVRSRRLLWQTVHEVGRCRRRDAATATRLLLAAIAPTTALIGYPLISLLLCLVPAVAVLSLVGVLLLAL